MDSILSVTAPASDLSLLTLDELRAAIGLKDNSKDADLRALGTRVFDRITQACRIAADGATPPTLRQETLTETFRFDLLRRWDWRSRQREIVLSRRPITQVKSVEEAGTVLNPATDYETLAAAGMLRRLLNDEPAHWGSGKVIVQYTAGWETVPEGLKLAAERLARAYWFQQSRDPAVRQINIPGVIERQYWISAASDPDIPKEIMDMLGPYRNTAVG